ncbi:TonB-dependent receptor [Wenyingzhuangia sp. chi5]|uniref:TonB-dependent receptor n=1 Tax=Wenyingzhuangia gilva TaxID=3057677 RepID=A0ABT8VNZ4_9FLAO|nr:TonB-dependent receptor [Wenyingzhuangia sp. chi5]MDO3693693.1 TonB-dependent receptor [Wenyingzhuangia sp. chi5]
MVKDFVTNEPLKSFELEIPNTSKQFFFTETNGLFKLNLSNEVKQIIIKAKEYQSQRVDVKELEINTIFLKPIDKIKEEFTLLNLTDDQLEDENGEVTNIAGIFSASDDVYLNTIGFEFQGVFYSARGLGSDQRTFLLNGVQQNRLYDDRPAWNNWGGVDGIYRSQEVTEPLAASEKTFGRALGVTSLTTRPSKYRTGTRLAYARSDRSYQNKSSLSHVGSLPNQWYYVVSASRRWGNEGYRDGTLYDANSLMLSVEKYMNSHNSLTASFLYTPNRRGVAGSYTDEVFHLKGNSYNGNWGFQNGNKRNARVRTVEEPMLLLTHTYEKENKTRWENSFLLQKGNIGYSRIDYNGGANPDAAYYQKLPSYWLSRNRVDYENVYRYEQAFLNNGQLDWDFIYQANAEMKAINQNAAYVLYDDKREESRIQFNSNITQKIKEDWHFNASIDYRNTNAENFAEVLDLLGGAGYLDVASFTLAQSDLNNPNRVVQEGDKFKYHYKINSSSLSAFAQTSWKGKRIEWSGALGTSYSSHQREGLYNYENYADAEGKSEKVSLLAHQAKGELLYKLSGRNLFNVKTAYIQKSPSVRQVFPNARVSNAILENLETENLFSNALSYIHRGLNYNIKLTGYYNLQSNVTETGFYFAEGFGTDAEDDPDSGDLLDENSLFVQEVLNNIQKKYVGLELGTSYDITSTIKLTGVIGLGDYTYHNNPNLLLYTEDDASAQNLGFVNGTKDLGTANIQGKKLSVGPQKAFSIMLAYNDPNYWRIRVSVNHFRNNYVDIAPIRYTSNFINEINGDPIANFNDDLVNLFRQQEQLKNFTLVNLSGGKSWRINTGYLSIYWNVQNVLDINYKTGGFASGRAANYSEQLKEYNRELPLFGNRYFVGNGRTFFTGLYYSF